MGGWRRNGNGEIDNDGGEVGGNRGKQVAKVGKVILVWSSGRGSVETSKFRRKLEKEG